MKFVKIDIADPKGKARQRYMFALGKEEAELIFDSLKRTYEYMPRHKLEYLQDSARLNNMLKAIATALPEFKEQRKQDEND